MNYLRLSKIQSLGSVVSSGMWLQVIEKKGNRVSFYKEYCNIANKQAVSQTVHTA